MCAHRMAQSHPRGATFGAAPEAACGSSAPTAAAPRARLAPASMASAYADVGSLEIAPGALPIVYHPRYNITLWGLERLHPFDAAKFSKVVRGLAQRGAIPGEGALVTPRLPGRALVERWHDRSYLDALYSSPLKAAQVLELAPLALLPSWLVRSKVLGPMEAHAAGTCLAVGLAACHGWSVNLGGGMHHAHARDGSGWCPFNDIGLAVQRIREASGGAIQRVVVIDLDAHQGNGVSCDKLTQGDADLFLVDLFNCRAFPMDREAQAGVDVKVELQPGTGDSEYLSKLDAALAAAAARAPHPDLVIYNAGTDILEGDPLGRLSVTPSGVVARDAAVWAWAAEQGAPLAMLLSGGYTRASAGVIADSLAALLRANPLAFGGSP